MTDAPLVWATRPQAQNEAWANRLRDSGYAVIELPLLAIVPLTEGEPAQAVKNLIIDFDQFQKVIFVSQNAVATAFDWLDTYWPQLPLGIDYFAVGRKTAQVVTQHGVHANAAETRMNSDELLAMPQMANVWGEKILICRGKGGLPRLGEALKERGAIVRYCELYERRAPESARAAVLNTLQQPVSRGEHFVPLFSGETLENLAQILREAALSPAKLSLIVPGKRVAELAKQLGFNSLSVAENASEGAMMAALAQARGAISN